MTLPEKIKKYELTTKDWFQHKHYTIITRQGIDKIQAIEKITINFEAIKVEPEFCVVKAIGVKNDLRVETFGSSKYGAKEWDNTARNGNGGWNEKGNTTTWYVMEMAEKRAMSRVVLKITGFYELGVFGEDESEDFTVEENIKKDIKKTKILNPSEKLKGCKTLKELQKVYLSLTRTEQTAMTSLKDELKLKLK